MYYPEEKKSPFRTGIKIVILLAGGIILGLLIARALFLPAVISGDSMEPNLNHGEKVLFFKFGKPEFGAIVLSRSPVEKGKVLVRRIIAVEGDTLEVKNREIFRNGNRINTTWRLKKRDSRNLPMGLTFRDTMPMVKMGRGEFFLLNDDIDNDYDSRTFGAVKSDMIIGVSIYEF